MGGPPGAPGMGLGGNGEPMSPDQAAGMGGGRGGPGGGMAMGGGRGGPGGGYGWTRRRRTRRRNAVARAAGAAAREAPRASADAVGAAVRTGWDAPTRWRSATTAGTRRKLPGQRQLQPRQLRLGRAHLLRHRRGHRQARLLQRTRRRHAAARCRFRNWSAPASASCSRWTSTCRATAPAPPRSR